MESLHFLNIILFTSPVKNRLTLVNLIFSYFPIAIFEFDFNPRWEIGWPQGHLDRVHQKVAYCRPVVDFVDRKISLMISVVYLNVEWFYSMGSQNQCIIYCPLQICNTFVTCKSEMILSQSCRHSKESLYLCYQMIRGIDLR